MFFLLQRNSGSSFKSVSVQVGRTLSRRFFKHQDAPATSNILSDDSCPNNCPNSCPNNCPNSCPNNCPNSCPNNCIPVHAARDWPMENIVHPGVNRIQLVNNYDYSDNGVSVSRYLNSNTKATTSTKSLDQCDVNTHTKLVRQKSRRHYTFVCGERKAISRTLYKWGSLPNMSDTKDVTHKNLRKSKTLSTSKLYKSKRKDKICYRIIQASPSCTVMYSYNIANTWFSSKIINWPFKILHWMFWKVKARTQKWQTFALLYSIPYIRMKNIEILGVIIFKILFFGNQRGEKKSISLPEIDLFSPRW